MHRLENLATETSNLKTDTAASLLLTESTTKRATYSVDKRLHNRENKRANQLAKRSEGDKRATQLAKRRLHNRASERANQLAKRSEGEEQATQLAKRRQQLLQQAHQWGVHVANQTSPPRKKLGWLGWLKLPLSLAGLV
ncbi:hypothetical protein PGT21_027327 [Puccinia graminis f. sp. tritici]|uniref:Uncharacterized protein n=1 Tax=Puccinia graminis f. sp. tritici TaxID=56615 RepID=A0A5B0N9F8_PUCGR|nr:hypothetical protein PGT21_027327 [Puccinia graminis f. sp. tritici]KAA1132962.1 hypothetical protein PGTUg99_012514 [Puccinia graminis f. sp. tritici]